MKILIVTGGIGSGKSYVRSLLTERFGIPVYEADRRAKELYSEYPDMLGRMEDALGTGLRGDDGIFAPKKLADIIFKDSGALRKVEEILFPVMKEDFASWAEAQGKGVVAFESATVLEKSEFDGFGDIVLLVDAPVPLRLARAMARDGADESEVMSRIGAQKLMTRLSEGEKCDRVDYVLLNDSSLEILEKKLTDFIGKYSLTKTLP